MQRQPRCQTELLSTLSWLIPDLLTDKALASCQDHPRCAPGRLNSRRHPDVWNVEAGKFTESELRGDRDENADSEIQLRALMDALNEHDAIFRQLVLPENT